MCLFLEALVFAGRGDEALALWQSASERGLRVLSRTLTRLMMASAESGLVRIEPSLGARLFEERLYGEGVSSAAEAIRAHGSRGAASDAVALYRRARVAPRLRRGASGKLSATQVNEHRQLLSAALVACARAADATLAVTLLHEVEEEGGKVLDPPHVATVMLACRNAGLLRTGYAELTRAYRADLACIVGLMTLLRGCELHADAPLALEVFRWGVRSGLLPAANPAEQNGAVQYLVGAVMPSGGRPANRQLLEAGRAIFSASSRWLAPEVQRTFGQELVLGFTLSGAVEDAVSLLAVGRAHGLLLAPNATREQDLISELYEAGRLAEARAVLDEMREQRTLPEWRPPAPRRRTFKPRTPRSKLRAQTSKVRLDKMDAELDALSRNAVLFGAAANAAARGGGYAPGSASRLLARAPVVVPRSRWHGIARESHWQSVHTHRRHAGHLWAAESTPLVDRDSAGQLWVTKPPVLRRGS